MDYIQTYYRQTLTPNATPYSRLTSRVEVDCCIIGAGIAGLSVASELLEQGKSVAILESHRVAWGASGRNGGFVSPGFALAYSKIQKVTGKEKAKKLYALSIKGMDIIKRNIESLQMPDVLQNQGELDVIRYKDQHSLQDRQRSSRQDFSLELEVLDRDSLKEQLQSEKYFGAIYNPEAFQIHPLNYCVHLAASIARKGGHIFEQTFVESTHKTESGFIAKSAHGEIHSTELIYCTSGYSGDVHKAIKRSIFPISTYVMLSENIGNSRASTIPTNSGVLDDRRASDYYRVVEGDKLLWGGHISTVEPSPKCLAQTMEKRLHQVFPQLKSVRSTLSWSGKMGYTKHKMPLVGKTAEGAWLCTAFGGHGLNTSSICGHLVANAIANNDTDYQLFDAFKPSYNFGLAGKAAVQLSYWQYQIQDWWRERRSHASKSAS